MGRAWARGPARANAAHARGRAAHGAGVPARRCASRCAPRRTPREHPPPPHLVGQLARGRQHNGTRGPAARGPAARADVLLRARSVSRGSVRWHPGRAPRHAPLCSTLRSAPHLQQPLHNGQRKRQRLARPRLGAADEVAALHGRRKHDLRGRGACGGRCEEARVLRAVCGRCAAGTVRAVRACVRAAAGAGARLLDGEERLDAAPLQRVHHGG